MTPVIPSSIGNASLFPTSTFTSRKDYKLTKCKLFGKYTKPTFPSQSFLLPHSVRLFPNYKTSISVVQHKSRIQIIAATGTDVVVEESDSAVEGEVIDKTSEVPPDAVETTKASSTENVAPAPTVRSKRTRPVRKSEMPPVKNEELIPGATFTGKVRSIQPFGAFIDFGAFTDGLIHVSQLSDGFVKDVGSIVSIGQEVKVRLLEANMETGRISLTMRESDDISKLQQRRDASASSSSDKPRPARKNGPKPNQKREEAPKTSKFVRGQVLDGTVKNLTRAGAFIALPEGEEGFLPTSEESEGFGNILGSSSLQVGQEVNVRILRITRGQVTLTMKKEEDVEELNMRLNRGVVHVATNPFELAFRKNAAIATFLEERERAKKFAEASDDLKKPEKIEGKVDKMKINTDALVNDKVDTEAELLIEDEILPAVENVAIREAPIADGVTEESNETDSLSDEIASSERVITTSGETKEVVAGQADVASVSGKVKTEEMPLVEEELPLVVENRLVGEAPIDELVKEDSSKAEAPGETGELDSSSESVVTEEVVMSQSSDALVSDKVGTVETLLVEDRVPSVAANTLLDEATMTNVVKEVISETKSSGETVDVISPEGLVMKEFMGEAADDLVSDKVDIGVTSVGEDHIPSAEVTTATEEASVVSAANQDGGETESLGETGGLISSSGSVVIEEGLLNQTDENLIDNEREDKLMPIAEGEADSTEATAVIDEAAAKLGAEEDNKETDTPSEKDDQFSSSESTVSEGAVTSQADDTLVKNEEVADTSSPVESKVSSTAVKEDTEVEPSIPEQNGSATSNEPTDVPSIQESVPRAVTISPALVKQLREETGAGMMDCKRALAQTGGDIVKAQEYLRKKGLASAEKKASRTTAEGRIGSYVHDNRIGVLIEVNCETDFVSRGDIFRELVDDLAMQVAACPQVQYLVIEDVPEEIVNKEREIEMQKEDLLTKPEQIRSKIVEGRIRKRLEELALLEQPYIKNDKVVVKDWVKQTISAIGENIKVKRFARFNLGEGLEKKSQDFAAEVAAQTAAKPPPAAPKDQSSGGDKETNEKPPTVVVSAALVKQLREETGAGMMDCKKALSVTGGDIEKAQEYLRKKGLSTADKKSSRLAAEGRIASYIHDSRIGVLIEVNCETDFVGRSEKFKDLVDDLAMQVVACPQVQFVSVEDIPESITNKERELEMQREDLQSKPENIRTRILDGRVAKRLGELVLLEQPFIKNDSILIKDLVKQTVAALGENIRVRRFVRFTLGEVIEDGNPATEA